MKKQERLGSRSEGPSEEPSLEEDPMGSLEKLLPVLCESLKWMWVKRGNQLADAEDLAEEVALFIWENREELIQKCEKKGSLKAFLASAGIRWDLSILRKQARRNRILEERASEIAFVLHHSMVRTK